MLPPLRYDSHVGVALVMLSFVGRSNVLVCVIFVLGDFLSIISYLIKVNIKKTLELILRDAIKVQSAGFIQ